MLDVPCGMLGGEIAALTPLGIAHGEGPGLEVLGCFPLAREMGSRHVVDAGAGQVAAYLAHAIRIIDPGKCVGTVELRNALSDPHRSAFWNLVRPRRLGNRLAGDLARPHIGGTCRHAEQGRVADELAAIDLLVRKLLLQLRNPDMFFLRHFLTFLTRDVPGPML